MTKYLGYQLSAQFKSDEKTRTSRVTGAYDTSQLAKLVDIFIDKYDLCGKGASKSMKKKLMKKDHSPTGSQVVDDDEDNVQWQTNTSMEAAQKRIKEHLSNVTGDIVLLENSTPRPCKPKPELGKDLKEYLNKGKGCVGSQLKTHLTSCSGTFSSTSTATKRYCILYSKLFLMVCTRVLQKR